MKFQDIKKSNFVKITIFLIITLIIVVFIMTEVQNKKGAKLANNTTPFLKIKLGYIKHLAELPVYVALEKKFFENEGIEVELLPFGYKEEVDALIRGDIDIIPATSLTLPFGIEAQSPGKIKIFSLGGIEDDDKEVVEGILVLENSSLFKMEDLKNRKIGVPEGATDYFVMKTVLTKLNLEPEKNRIQIVQLKKDLLPQVLISKQVDAVYITQPQLASVKKQVPSRYLIINPRAKYVFNPFWSGGGVIITDYLKDEGNKIKFKKYLRAIDKAIDYSRNNPLEAKGFLTKYANIEDNVVSDVGSYFKVKSTEGVDMDSLQKIADIYTEVGILDKKINVAFLIVESQQ